MKETFILSTLKSAIKLEILNDYIIKKDEIIIKLSNGTIAKITTKNVA